MTAALEGDERSAARPSSTLTPGNTRYPFYRRLGGPQGRSGRVENLVPTGIWSRTVEPAVSRYTDWLPDPYIYRYIYIYVTHIYIYICTYTHTHTHTHTYVCMSLSLVLSPVLDLMCRVNFCDLEKFIFFPCLRNIYQIKKIFEPWGNIDKKKIVWLIR